MLAMHSKLKHKKGRHTILTEPSVHVISTIGFIFVAHGSILDKLGLADSNTLPLPLFVENEKESRSDTDTRHQGAEDTESGLNTRKVVRLVLVLEEPVSSSQLRVIHGTC